MRLLAIVVECWTSSPNLHRIFAPRGAFGATRSACLLVLGDVQFHKNFPPFLLFFFLPFLLFSLFFLLFSLFSSFFTNFRQFVLNTSWNRNVCRKNIFGTLSLEPRTKNREKDKILTQNQNQELSIFCLRTLEPLKEPKRCFRTKNSQKRTIGTDEKSKFGLKIDYRPIFYLILKAAQ